MRKVDIWVWVLENLGLGSQIIWGGVPRTQNLGVGDHLQCISLIANIPFEISDFRRAALRHGEM